MAEDRLEAFRAASKFAEFAADATVSLFVYEQDELPERAAQLVANVCSEWERHSDVIDSYRGELSKVAKYDEEYAGQMYPHAHAAALGLMREFMLAIERALLRSRAIDKRDAVVPSKLPILDVTVIVSNWPIVRDAVLCFARELRRWDPTLDKTFDTSLLKGRVAVERNELLERMRDDLATPPADDKNWPTVTKAAREQGVEPYVITRAANNGELATNGKIGRDRRIDPASLIDWNLRRAEGNHSRQ